MAAPVAGEANLPLQNSDLHLVNNVHRTTIVFAEDDFTISQLARSKTSHPNPSPPAPSTSSLGKRRKSKPVRYGVSATIVEKKHSPAKPNDNVLVGGPSFKCLSFQKENSETKCLKSPVVNSPAMIRAGEVQSSLGTKYPSCIRLMVKSHIGTGYWMGFWQPFSRLFLPNTDSDMVIEDENGEIYHLKYIANKNGLSAGWKSFAVGHNLLEGDVLVFHLVEPRKFKVYIIRANDLNKVNGGLSLLNLEIHQTTDTPSPTTNRKKHKLSTPTMEHSGHDSEEVGSEVLEGSKPNLPFQELKTFQDFHIVVKGKCIDSELPDDVRMNYYKLCIGRKEFLHDTLPEGLYYKLVAGMIGQTVNIANEIKNCRLTTTKEEFEAWDNSLKSFALLGLKVGFLRHKVRMLATLVFESEGRLDVERYMEAKNERKRIEDEIKQLMGKLEELKESSRRFEGILDGLKEKVGRHWVKFQEEVDAPW